MTQASDFQSPRSAALGGAGHASPLLNDALYLNPSFAAFLPTYSASINYQWFNGSSLYDVPDPPVNLTGRIYNVSLIDGTKSDLFHAGLGYTVREDGAFVHIGVAKSFVKRLGFGIGSKYFISSRDGESNTFDFSFSSTYAPFDWLQMALIVDNITEPKQSVAQGLLREFTFGVKFNAIGIVIIYFDPHFTPGEAAGRAFGHELGVEITLYQSLFWRLGSFRNAQLSTFEGDRAWGYSTGIGWVGPRFSFDYALHRVLGSPAGHPAVTSHLLGMTLYF